MSLFNTVATSSIPYGYSKLVSIEIPSQCPSCQVAYNSKPLAVYLANDENPQERVYAVYYCPNCRSCFMVCYIIANTRGPHRRDFRYPTLLDSIYPPPTATTFMNDDIRRLSPNFVDIFHQAEIAENSGLTDICGLGYRKALEFLVKDFAIHCNPDETENIKTSALSQCIDIYIDAPDIKTLASRSAWLGNDEAHYVRRHTGRDVSDLKRFILTTAYFISSTLILEDAGTITPK